MLFSRNTKKNWLLEIRNHKLVSWIGLHILLIIGLFSYAFSYWRDTGMGESPSLPIGYNQRIYSPDFAWTYFYPDPDKTDPNEDELKIDSFVVIKNKLCASVSHAYSDSPDFDFIVYDLSSATLQKFLNETDYRNYAQLNGLPMTESFKDFKTHHHLYINSRPKWKRWLLP